MNRTDIQKVESNGPLLVDEPQRVNVFDYLFVLLRYRWLLLGLMLLGGAALGAYLLVMPQTFIAGATLLPPDKSEGVSLTALVQGGRNLDFGALSENASAETFVKIIMSRSTGDSLVRRFNLLELYGFDSSQRQVAIDMVLGSLTATADRQGYITIVYAVKTGYFSDTAEQRKAAELSADIVNASMEVLDNINRKKLVSRARRSREFIGAIKEDRRARLDSIQAELQLFQQKNKSIALDKQVAVSSEAIVQLQTEIQKKEIEISTAQAEMLPGTPKVQMLETQLSQLKRQQRDLEAGKLGGGSAGVALATVPALARRYASLQMDLEIATQVYTYLEAKYNEEEVQEARDLPTVQTLDAAFPPIRRSAPKRGMMLALGLAAILVVSVILVYLIHAIRRGWGTLDAARRAHFRALVWRKSKQAGPTSV